MTKWPLLFFCLLVTKLLTGQILNLDNNLTGILSNNQNTQASLQFSGLNKFEYKLPHVVVQLVLQ